MNSAGTTITGPGARAGQQSPAAAVLLWVTFVLAAATFAALAYSAHSVPYYPIDLDIARAVQGVPAPWFHALMFAVSWPGFPPQVYIFVVIVAIAFYVGHRRREAVYLVFSSVGIAIVSQGVKLLVDRPRPSPSLIHVLLPGLNGGHWSFPAGHVESCVVVFGFIMFVAYTEWRPSIARAAVLLIGLLMIMLIGVSRIDSGEHWFSDVAGGYLLGSLFLIGLLYFFQRGRRRAAQDAATPANGPA